MSKRVYKEGEAMLYIVPDGLLLDDGREKISLPDTMEALETAIGGYRKRLFRTAFMAPAHDPEGHTQLLLSRHGAAIEVLEMRKADLEGAQGE